jgi:hypothetical protein
MGLPKVKTASALREDVYESLAEVSKGQKILITHKSGESILLSKFEYDAIIDEVELQRSVVSGLQDYIEERTLSHAQAQKEFKKMRKLKK